MLGGDNVLRTIGIYIYAGLLVVATYFKLQKAKKSFHSENDRQSNEYYFEQPKTVSRKVLERTGSTVTVKGQENLPDGAVLFVANHQGLFDILALLGYLGKPVGFIAKKEINKLPIIRSWMKLIYCVFIDRNDRRQSMKAINEGIEYLKDGHSLVIFPEGTRSRGGKLNPFKPGSLRLATKARVPIVPITINGTYQMLEEDGGRIKASDVSLTIGKPMYPEAYKEMKSAEIAESLQNTIEKTLQTENAEKNAANIEEALTVQ